MGDKAGWAQVVVAVLAIVCSMLGSWIVITNSVTEIDTKVVEVERRVTANEAYDGTLQEEGDAIRERVIRNEEGIKYLNGSLDSLAASLESIALDIKETNRHLNDFIIEQAKKED